MLNKIVVIILFLFAFNAKSALKIATLDWTIAETLLAIGAPIDAIGDAESYRIWVSQPELPKHIYDLGLRLQPNKEVIAQADADLFINSDMFSSLTPILQQEKTDVKLVNFYQSQGEIWQNIENATLTIAKLADRQLQAEQLITQTTQYLADLKDQLKIYHDRPVAVVQFIDTRHLRIYGINSLFGSVLAKLGFNNVWQHQGGMWGTENISITDLAHLPRNTRLIVVKPYPSNVSTTLTYNTLWQYLPLSKDAIVLPAVWTFGALPSARRFANELAKGLEQGGEKW